jgi:hypothetical protein
MARVVRSSPLAETVEVSRRRKRLHAEIGGFMKKYGKKKHPNRFDPNDRQIDHELERELMRLPPEELNDLLHGDLEGDSEHPEAK